MNVFFFIRAMVHIFSFGERLNVQFNFASFHLSPHENICTIALTLIIICMENHETLQLSNPASNLQPPIIIQSEIPEPKK